MRDLVGFANQHDSMKGGYHLTLTLPSRIQNLLIFDKVLIAFVFV